MAERIGSYDARVALIDVLGGADRDGSKATLVHRFIDQAADDARRIAALERDLETQKKIEALAALALMLPSGSCSSELFAEAKKTLDAALVGNSHSQPLHFSPSRARIELAHVGRMGLWTIGDDLESWLGMICLLEGELDDCRGRVDALQRDACRGHYDSTPFAAFSSHCVAGRTYVSKTSLFRCRECFLTRSRCRPDLIADVMNPARSECAE